MGKTVYKDKEWLQQKYWKEKKSARKVAKEAGVTNQTVLRWMRKHNIPRRDRIEHNDVELTEESRSYLQGHIIGDGCITNYNGKTALFSFSNKHRQVVEWNKSKLESYGFETGNITEKSGGLSKAYSVRTKSYVELGKIRERWYPDNHKSIPKNFELSSQALLHWYIGDGCFHKGAVTLSTDWFEKKEVEYLISELSKLGLNANLSKHEDNFTIYIQKDSTSRFFELIGERPSKIECYDYKWPE